MRRLMMFVALLVGFTALVVPESNGAAQQVSVSSGTATATVKSDAAVAGDKYVMTISAQIDGLSVLKIEGNTVQWYHVKFAAPGMYGVYKGKRGAPTTFNGADWYPSFPKIGENYNCQCSSAMSAFLHPGLPRKGAIVFTKVNCRELCSATVSDGSARIVFDDRQTPGPATYVVSLTFQVAQENSISGTVYRLVCTQTECRHSPPLGAVTLVASSGSDSSSTTTNVEGAYTIDGLKSGIWRVAPSVEGTKTSLPRARTVTFGEVPGSASGIDFNVCDERPLPNVPDGCAPIFDYTMPARVADSALTSAYANPSSFPVVFTVRSGACDQSANFVWYVSGKQVVDHPGPEPCQFTIDFKKLGTYEVRVDQQLKGASNESTSYIGKVVVQDFLDISVGDSLASGEGNPPYTRTLTCDDSQSAYGSLAATKLEAADPRSSVTFLQLACSGAKIDTNIAELPGAIKALGSKGVFTGKENATLLRLEQGGHNSISNQLVLAHELAGGRHIDALTISIGINNLNFGSIVAECIVRYRCQDPPRKIKILGQEVSEGSDLGKTVPASIEELKSFLDDLHSVISDLFPTSQLAPRDIYVVSYPDPLHNQAGLLCPMFMGSGNFRAFQNAHGEDEVTWAQNAFMSPLQHATQYFALGWNIIDTQSAFLTHGYCSSDSWFNHVSDVSITTNAAGILHPNRAGQNAIASQLEVPLLARLIPEGTARPPV